MIHKFITNLNTRRTNKLKKSKTENKSFNCYKSSVLDSLDYNFAFEIYPDTHPWFEFTEYIKDNIIKKYQVNIFNIKCEYKNDMFNIYVYLGSLSDFDNISPTIGSFLNDDFIRLEIKKGIQQFKPNVLKDLTLNPNGICFRNIDSIEKSWVLKNSFPSLNNFLKNKYSIISSTSNWNSTIYIFIESIEALEVFIKYYDHSSLKKECLQIIKPFDKNNVFNICNINIRVDNYEIYHKIGGYNYFNSDYFINAQVL